MSRCSYAFIHSIFCIINTVSSFLLPAIEKGCFESKDVPGEVIKAFFNTSEGRAQCKQSWLRANEDSPACLYPLQTNSNLWLSAHTVGVLPHEKKCHCTSTLMTQLFICGLHSSDSTPQLMLLFRNSFIEYLFQNKANKQTNPSYTLTTKRALYSSPYAQ